MGYLLVRLNYDQDPRESGGRTVSTGWSGVGGVRWFTWGPRAAVANEDVNQREMRRRREGGGLEGAR